MLKDHLFCPKYPMDKSRSYFCSAGAAYKAIANAMTSIDHHFLSSLGPDQLALEFESPTLRVGIFMDSFVHSYVCQCLLIFHVQSAQVSHYPRLGRVRETSCARNWLLVNASLSTSRNCISKLSKSRMTIIDASMWSQRSLMT